MCLETNLEATWEWLLYELGLEQEELLAIMMSFPSLLCYSVDDNLGPQLDYFVDRSEPQPESSL